MPPDYGPAGSSYTAPPAHPGLPGWLLIAGKILAWLVLLIILLVPFAIWRLFTPHRVWPRIFFKGFCAIMRLRITVHGTPHRNALYLPNHLSWMDTPAILAVTGSAFVGNDGLTGIFALKWLASLNDTVFIARHRRSTVGAQVEDVRKAVADTGALTIFIEGTTSTGDMLLPFKSALLAAIEPLPEGLEVQPVMLRYPEGPDVGWVGEEPGFDNLKRMLGRWRPIDLEMHFLEPLAGDALADRKSTAAAARSAIAARLGVE